MKIPIASKPESFAIAIPSVLFLEKENMIKAKDMLMILVKKLTITISSRFHLLIVKTNNMNMVTTKAKIVGITKREIRYPLFLIGVIEI